MQTSRVAVQKFIVFSAICFRIATDNLFSKISLASYFRISVTNNNRWKQVTSNRNFTFESLKGFLSATLASSEAKCLTVTQMAYKL